MGDSRRQSMFVIRERKQVAALASPSRQEIVDAVAAAGACTMARIGELLGRRADTLYYHVAALVKVGLLLEVGRERAGKRFGAVYDVPGRPMRIDYEAAGSAAVTRVVASAIRLGGRDFSRAVASSEAVTTGRTRNLWGGRAKGWVTEKDMPEMNRLIERMTELVQRGKPRDGSWPQSFTYVLTPVVKSGRGRKKNKAQ